MDLATHLGQFTTQAQNELEVFFDDQLQQVKAIDTNLEQSVRVLKDFSLRGGKMVRPYLTSLAYSLSGGKPHNGLLKACLAVELNHRHILILDDISDRDETRYGGPTVEYAYHTIMNGFPDWKHKSRSFAMLDAVFLGTLSKELLIQSRFKPEILIHCLHELNTTMLRDTLAGWQIHGMQASRPIVDTTPDEFIKGLKLVTARYTFTGPLMFGLHLSENNDSELEQSLRAYGDAVGTAFQIHDDILGLFGETEKTGKPVGNDVREGKKTLLLQYAYAHGDQSQKDFLTSVIGSPLSQTDLQTVQEIVTTTGALEDSKRQAKEMVETGINALGRYADTTEGELLIQLAHYVINREK